MESIINGIPKRYILARKDVIGRIKRQTRCNVLCHSLSEVTTNEKNEKRSRLKIISRIGGSETPKRIVMKFFHGDRDVVTRAKLDGDRFGHFCVVGAGKVEFQVFSLTFVVVLVITFLETLQDSTPDTIRVRK